MDNLYNRLARRRRGGESGFTLIELLVVIAVLLVLALIVIFNVVGVSNKGSSSACLTDKQSLQTASDAYYNDHQAYPGQWSDIVPAYLHTQPTSLGTVTWGTSGNNGTVNASNCPNA